MKSTDYDAAKAYVDECLAIMAKHGDRPQLTSARYQLVIRDVERVARNLKRKYAMKARTKC